MSTDVTRDFIFGTLATDDLRLDALMAQRRGLSHNNLIDPPDPTGGQIVSLTVVAGTDTAVERVAAFYSIGGSDPTVDGPNVEFLSVGVEWDTLTWGYRQLWRGDLPAQPDGTLVRYRIVAWTFDGSEIEADADPITGSSPTFAYHVDRESVPDWLRNAVIYHVFLDRFNPGSGRDWNQTSSLSGIWGGTISGVTERLPYFADLGITCLWLSPLFPSPTHHGYDATDYTAVEPRLGTIADMDELFHEAHARGIRVILDFVANHVSDEHPRFVAARDDPAAPERSWFTFTSEPPGYRSFFGVSTMPQVDVESTDARRYLIDAAVYWLERGADGFRLDYANGPTHAFWSEFRAATRAIKPDSVTIGEIVETAELQRSYLGRLDGTLDFLLLQKLRSFFAFASIKASEFDHFLRRHLSYFPAGYVLPTFLDNHDMNRFLWIANGDKRTLKLAAICQFTLPHPPIVYYGTEVGLNQAHDLEYQDGSRRPEESRVLMPSEESQDRDLRTFFTALIALRRSNQGLWAGTRTTLAAGDDGFYVVRIEASTGSAIVALNRSDSSRVLQIPPGGTVALSSESVTIGDNGDWIVAPHAGAVFLIEPVTN